MLVTWDWDLRGNICWLMRAAKVRCALEDPLCQCKHAWRGRFIMILIRPSLLHLVFLQHDPELHISNCNWLLGPASQSCLILRPIVLFDLHCRLHSDKPARAKLDQYSHQVCTNCVIQCIRAEHNTFQLLYETFLILIFVVCAGQRRALEAL